MNGGYNSPFFILNNSYEIGFVVIITWQNFT